MSIDVWPITIDIIFSFVQFVSFYQIIIQKWIIFYASIHLKFVYTLYDYFLTVPTNTFLIF